MINYQQNVQQYFHNILVRSFKFVHSILSCRQLWSKLKTSSNVTDTAMTDDKRINKTHNGNTIIMIVRCCRLHHVVLCVITRDVCCQSETWQPTNLQHLISVTNALSKLSIFITWYSFLQSCEQNLLSQSEHLSLAANSTGLEQKRHRGIPSAPTAW